LLSIPLPPKASAICESVIPSRKDIKSGADEYQNKNPDEGDGYNIVITPQKDLSQRQISISCNKGKG